MTDKTKIKKSFSLIITIWLNYFFIICISLSYLSYYINPNTSWHLSFFGLLYPLFLLINICFVLFWIIRLKKYFIISTFFILIGYGHISNLYQAKAIKQPDNKSNLFKVMSYNVKVFNVYDYKKDWSHKFEKRNKIFSFIKKENPEIICYQEFFTDKSKKFIIMDSLLSFQKAKYHHIKYYTISRKTNCFGIATFSKYPIINKGSIAFPIKNGNLCIYSDIIVYKDTFRIYNMHLASLRMNTKDYELAKKLNNIYTTENNNVDSNDINDIKRIVIQIKKAFINRGTQSKIIANHISNCQYPIILCGDFNDNPSSYTYQKISSNLNDAFIESGSGFGGTYIGEFPSLRIDYIFHSDEIQSYNFITHPEVLSDHHAISCEIDITERKKE